MIAAAFGCHLHAALTISLPAHQVNHAHFNDTHLTPLLVSLSYDFGAEVVPFRQPSHGSRLQNTTVQTRFSTNALSAHHNTAHPMGVLFQVPLD